MRRMLIVMCAIICTLSSGAIDKVLLIGKEEMSVDGDEILHLSGIGLCLKCGNDSVIMLDNPELSAIKWLEPNDARSIVGCGNAVYAAEGDSIYRLASESVPRRFIGRLDNEQFMLYPATDSTFYACTADEDFSCVYEINPSERTCMPFISVKSALLKISTLGDKTMVWIDDQVLLASDDGNLVPVFSSETITDIQLTPIGLIAASADGLNWLTGPGKGAVLDPKPVSRVWWDDADILYYLTDEGDLYAVIGFMETYMELVTDRPSLSDKE